jgi:hypothetical protein
MASTIAPELMGRALARQNITCSLLRWHKLTLTPLLLRLRLTSDNPDGARSYSRVGRLLVGPPARLPQRIEVDQKELRIMGSKRAILRTLVAVSSAKTAGFGVPSSVPKWRAAGDSNS